MLESLPRAGADKGLPVFAVDWNEGRNVFREIVKVAKSYQLKFVSDENGWAGSSYEPRADAVADILTCTESTRVTVA